MKKPKSTIKKNSFISQTRHLFALQMAVLSVILLLFIFFSWKSAEQNSITANENLMQLYCKELEYQLENAQNLLAQMMYDGSDYVLLQSDSESDRYYAAIRIKDKMADLTLAQSQVDSLVVAESSFQQFLDEESDNISSENKTAIREFMLNCAAEESLTARWSISDFGGKYCLYKVYVWKGRAIGVFITVSTFMDTAAAVDLDDLSILLTDDENRLYGCYGTEISGLNLGQILENPEGLSNDSSYALADGELYIHARFSQSGIIRQITGGTIFLAVMLFLSLLVTAFLTGYSRRQILLPMEQMTEHMQKIREGDYQLRITTEYQNSEFSQLKDTFNMLMDEIVGLKIRSYEKQIALQETELKCIRLQIRPHFFLNAMTTISSLSIQGRNEEIVRYIDALSKNIRYMFQSGLHTVALQEELLHVKNYFAMQELKYPNCVFYMIELEPGLEKWPIPQMLIHTVIENAYKYAISVENILTLLIKITKEVQDDSQFLHIHIEDDGPGYSEEILLAFEKNEAPKSENGSRVGLQSLAQMLNLMYEGKGFFQIRNADPHGSITEFWIPEKAAVETTNII